MLVSGATSMSVKYKKPIDFIVAAPMNLYRNLSMCEISESMHRMYRSRVNCLAIFVQLLVISFIERTQCSSNFNLAFDIYHFPLEFSTQFNTSHFVF